MQLTNIHAPCLNCQDRQIGCHGKCQNFIEFQAKNDVVKRKRLEAKQKEEMLNSCLNGVTKMRLYRGW